MSSSRPDDSRHAALLRESEARAKALDAERRGEWNAAAGHRADARRALADALDTPDPAVDEVANWLFRKEGTADWCRQMERHYRGQRDDAEAEAWMRDAGRAEADVWRLKELQAGSLLRMLRFAEEAMPAALDAALAQTPTVRELLGTVGSLVTRLANAETMLLRLADGRAVSA